MKYRNGAAPVLFPVPGVVATADLVVASLDTGDGWGLRHYRDLESTGQGHALLVPVTTALWTSLRIAVVAATLALLLGCVVAFLVSRRWRTRPPRIRARNSPPSRAIAP